MVLWHNVKVIDVNSGPARTTFDRLVSRGPGNAGLVSAGIYGGSLYIVITSESSGVRHRELLTAIPIREIADCTMRPRGAFFTIDGATRTVRLTGASETLGPLLPRISETVEKELQNLCTKLAR